MLTTDERNELIEALREADNTLSADYNGYMEKLADIIGFELGPQDSCNVRGYFDRLTNHLADLIEWPESPDIDDLAEGVNNYCTTDFCKDVVSDYGRQCSDFPCCGECRDWMGPKFAEDIRSLKCHTNPRAKEIADKLRKYSSYNFIDCISKATGGLIENCSTEEIVRPIVTILEQLESDNTIPCPLDKDGAPCYPGDTVFINDRFTPYKVCAISENWIYYQAESGTIYGVNSVACTHIGHEINSIADAIDAIIYSDRSRSTIEAILSRVYALGVSKGAEE